MSANGQQVRLPAIECPLPAAVHGEIEAMEGHVLSWMWHHGYISNPEEERRARGARFGTLAGLTYPSGHRDGVQLAADWLVWFFLHDDWHVEGIAEPDGDHRFGRPGPAPSRREEADQRARFVWQALRALRLLKDPDDIPTEPGPHLMAFRELCVRLRGMATDEQVRRITAAVTEYFLGGGCEVLYRTAGAGPPLEDYPMLRELSSSLPIFFAFIDVVAGFELPNALWSRPDVQALTRSASLVVAYTNDVLSCSREFSWPGSVNLPVVLARHHGGPLEKAMERAADLIEFETDAFVFEADRLRIGADGRLLRYIAGLESWIRGHFDWGRTTDRYHVDTPDPTGDLGAAGSGSSRGS